MTSFTTDTETIVKPTVDDGDHDRFSHYVKKDEILPSTIEGTPVKALCGKVWVPTRDPKRYPVCPTCKEIMDSLSSD